MKFEKITKEEYNNFVFENNSFLKYEKIILPELCEYIGAGYNIRSTKKVVIRPKDFAIIQTGIRAVVDDDKILMILPDTLLSRNFKLQLDSTAKIIGPNSLNNMYKGHIVLKITNDSNVNDSFTIEKGQIIAQAFILPNIRL